jgi:hypothetical protein
LEGFPGFSLSGGLPLPLTYSEMLPTTEKQNTAQNAENSHNWESVADTEL